MGTGVAFSPSPLDHLIVICFAFYDYLRMLFFKFALSKLYNNLLLFLVNSFDQALGLLVSVSYIHCCTYTSDLSTMLSTWVLTSFNCGKSYLEAGFALRCLQRLSVPDLATQLCLWQDNWCTIGPSIPVLSY